MLEPVSRAARQGRAPQSAEWPRSAQEQALKPADLSALRRDETANGVERLLADSALCRAMLAACGFPIALADAGAKGQPISYVNPAFETFFGYRVREALGQPVGNLLFPRDETATTMFERAPSRVQMRARRKDGTEGPVELTIGMVHGADGRLTHWVLAFAGRLEIERLRDELRLVRAIAAAP